MGYYRAGFDVVGVDLFPQPHYPFEFVQADALDAINALIVGIRPAAPMYGWYLECFDAVHASPPCQFKTAYNRRPNHVAPSPNLIPQTRNILKKTGLPYVIENVEYARDHLIDPIRLCGSSFGLDVRRHRLFECSFPAIAPQCAHWWQMPRFAPATNRVNLRSTVEVGVWRIPLEVQQRAMGIDWMDLKELSEAIPPAYTEYIGKQLLLALD